MKRKKTSLTRLNWLVDIVLLFAITPLYFINETGRNPHQILGVVFGIGILYHIALHWRWVVAITKRLFKRQPRQTRINYAVNWLMLLSLTGSIATGLPIATWFVDKGDPSFRGAVQRAYYDMLGLHSTFSYVFLGLVCIHLWLHRKWIIKTSQRYLPSLNLDFAKNFTK